MESDVARRGDPGLDDVAFVGDRVLRWVEWNCDPVAMVGLLRRGASGYPTNASGCRSRAASLGLTAGPQLRPAEPGRIVQSTCALVVSVYETADRWALGLEDVERVDLARREAELSGLRVEVDRLRLGRVHAAEVDREGVVDEDQTSSSPEKVNCSPPE